MISRPSVIALRTLRVGLCLALITAAIYLPMVVVLPPYAVLQAVFRHFLFPLIAGEHGEHTLPHSPGLYFLVITPIVIAAAFVSYRRLMAAVPPESYVGAAAKTFCCLAFLTYLANAGVQGGIGIPLALGYAVLLLLVWWEALRLDRLRTIVEALVWAGAGFLISSGAVIPLVGGGPRFDLQRLHGVYGYLWMAALGAYLITHIAHYDAKRETASRTRGYFAALAVAAAVLTGVARLHGGGETYGSSLWPHLMSGIAALIATALHIGQSWQRRGVRVPLGPGAHRGTMVLGCLGFGALLPALVLVSHRPWNAGLAHDAAPTERRPPGDEQTSESSGMVALGADEDRLATPGLGITASGPDHRTLPNSIVSVRDSQISCGKNGGCHVDVQAQWEHSAHRFAANPAYRQTVRLLVAESGVEAARLCAGCHDPVPLLTGQIVAGSGYPFEESEGVTCVVCHSMRPGSEGNNGHYIVQPSAVFHDGVKDPFTAYMMVALYRQEHRADHLSKELKSNDICAPCHSLTTAHLTLRSTFSEWHEGPFGPGKPDSKSCTGCHMPQVGSSYLSFPLHDHRTPAANIALAPLRGESPELEASFIAKALELDLGVARPSVDRLEIVARLKNENGGHVFPTAPRDLLEYWFEARVEGQGVDSPWQHLGEGGLFDETLTAAGGETLTRHEIWRATKRTGHEGIPPRESRQYTYVLSDVPSGAESVAVRLMHRRYGQGFLKFLEAEGDGLYTGSVEILRKEERIVNHRGTESAE